MIMIMIMIMIICFEGEGRGGRFKVLAYEILQVWSESTQIMKAQPHLEIEAQPQLEIEAQPHLEIEAHPILLTNFVFLDLYRMTFKMYAVDFCELLLYDEEKQAYHMMLSSFQKKDSLKAFI